MTLLTATSFGQNKDSADFTSAIFVCYPMASYPGGNAEMNTFIKKNFKYPKDSRCVEGKIFIEFMVNENGSLSEFRIVKGLLESFDNSALEVVKKMPNWIPAKRGNKPIRTKMVIPIAFNIS